MNPEPDRTVPSGDMAGLYVHVPFCLRVCRYCDFMREAPPHPDRIQLFLDALKRELEFLPSLFTPRTIYIGGGTPTALPPAARRRLLQLLRPLAGGIREWTVEANPGTLSPRVLEELLAAGVTRLSIGAQSFQPRALRVLGRIHGPEDIRTAVQQARAAGFRNVSLDLILAVPGRSLEGTLRDLEELLALQPEHISTYLLSLEPGTPLEAEVSSGQRRAVPESRAVREYEMTRQLLTASGYRQYEISNFARPGLECLHNLNYWTGGEYIGLGPSAHSHWKGVRWANFQSLDAWAAALSKGWKPRESEECLPHLARAREHLIFWLRLLDGVPRADYRQRFGMDWHEVAGPEIQRLIQQGLLEETPTHLRLTPQAWLISDAVFRELV